jgi:hypothetical protein
MLWGAWRGEIVWKRGNIYGAAQHILDYARIMRGNTPVI